MRLIRLWWCDRSGATIVEYSLIAGIMTMVILSAFSGLLDSLLALFNNIDNAFIANTGG